MSKSKQNLIWIDLEMTGLNPDRDLILEVATVVTDPHLKVLGEGPVFAIHQSHAALEKMDEWCTKQHGQSGLTDRVLKSTVTEAQAQSETIEFLKDYVPSGASPMCGNSICQDRRFLYRYMPELESYFHYRNLDVSSLKELAARWHPNLLKQQKEKNSQHLALADIHDSIEELRYYREHFIRVP